MIIIEGADNSGKSSLAAKFSKIGLPVYFAGPAPKNRSDEITCLNQQLGLAKSQKGVLDRVTCISQQVYANRMFDKFLGTALMQLMEIDSTVLIYCRPPNRTLMDMSTHIVKEYDTEEHIQKILDNQHVYIDRYDSLMSTLPAVVYDWTDQSLNIDKFLLLAVEAQSNPMEWNKLCPQPT